MLVPQLSGLAFYNAKIITFIGLSNSEKEHRNSYNQLYRPSPYEKTYTVTKPAGPAL